MTIELLDTEEAQADDPLDVQVKSRLIILVIFNFRKFR